MSKQLLEKQGNNYNHIYPLTRLEDIIDKISDKSIQWILNNYNHIYVEYTESVAITRNKVPTILRRNGLWITYNTGEELITEYYIGDNKDITNYIQWTHDENWRKFDKTVYDEGTIEYKHLSEELKQLIEAGGDTNIINVPDNEDLETKDGVLKFKDREYNKEDFSGLGHIILRKNIINIGGKPKNVLTQDMINKSNTIYEIRYDFDLTGVEISIPEDCVLKFEGGSINNGTIVANSSIVTGNALINTVIIGTFLSYDKKPKIINPLNKIQREIISSQESFDSVIEEVAKGNKISADILSGVYFLNPTILKGDLTLIGRGDVTIYQKLEKYSIASAIRQTDTHYVCPLSNPIPEYSVFVSREQIVPVSEITDAFTKVNSTNEKIINYNIESGLFKLPIVHSLQSYANKESFTNVFGWLDSLWATIKFSVISSDSTHFLCKRISPTNVENLNGDIEVNGDTLNYVLFNLEVQPNSIYYTNSEIYIPIQYTDIVLIPNSSEYIITASGSVVLENIKIINCTAGINFTPYINTSLSINNCTFKNILGNAVLYNESNQIKEKETIIENNKFIDCGFVKDYVIKAGDPSLDTNFESENLIINECKFISNSSGTTQYKNASSIVMVGRNSRITNCDFQNGIRGGLFLNKGKIEVTNCTLHNTKEFNSNIIRNYSRDFGMIYCCFLYKNDNDALTNTNNTILISNCRIYNFSGKGDTRGIFIDDGRGDVTCQYNVITGNEMYSIDARNVTSINGYSYSMSSIRNKFINNLCTTPYRLLYGDGVDTSNKFVSSNIVLDNVENKTNFDVEDVLLSPKDVSINEAFVSVNKYYKNIIKGLPYVHLNNLGVITDVYNYTNNKIVGIHIPKALLTVKPLVVSLKGIQNINFDVHINSQKTSSNELLINIDDTKFEGKYAFAAIRLYELENGDVDVYLCSMTFNGLISTYAGYWNVPSGVTIDGYESWSDISYQTPKISKIIINDNAFSGGFASFNQTRYDEYILPIAKEVTTSNIKEYSDWDGGKRVISTRHGFKSLAGPTDSKPTIPAHAVYSGFMYYDTTQKIPIWNYGSQWYKVNGILANVLESGTTEERPSQIYIKIGFQYYDTTLNKPIWWTGSKWVDANGATV